MAVEQSPGTKRGQEPTAPTPTPTTPAVDPAELAAARAEAEQLKRQHASELEQIRTALSDPDTVEALAKAARQKSGKPEPAAADEDDTALVDRKELKRYHEELKRSVATVLGTESANAAKQIRSTQVSILKPTLAHYGRYEEEINALLDKLDPRQAAQAETIRNVHKLVLSQHQGELETEAEKRIRVEERDRLRARGYDVEDDEFEDATQGGDTEPAPTPVRARDMSRPAAPSSSVAVSRTSQARRERAAAQWESRDQKAAAEIFGIKNPDEWKQYADPNWKPDIMNFRGRDRV